MNFKIIIQFLGSMLIAKYLLLSTAISLFIGNIYYNLNSEIFVPLNSYSLIDWLDTYGANNIAYTWWFYLFIVLMFLLGINTFFCSVDRTYNILKRYGKLKGEHSVLLLLSPHIMHFSFILLMLGYFCLYSFGINTYNNIVKPGSVLKVHGTDIKVSVSKFTAKSSDGTIGLSSNYKYLNPRFHLILNDKCKITKKIIGLNEPGFYKGYSIHLADYNPKSKSGMTRKKWANLTIRKNVGIPLFMSGVAFFIVGALLYLISILKTNKNKLSVRDNNEVS